MSSTQNRPNDASMAFRQSWKRIVAIIERPGFRAAMKETKLYTLNTVLFSILFVATTLFSQATLSPPSVGTPQ
jgi:hypothetical protein